MRVAAIDCGTNSLRLLIADVDGYNFREVHRDMRVVRLGQGILKKALNGMPSPISSLPIPWRTR